MAHKRNSKTKGRDDRNREAQFRSFELQRARDRERERELQSLVQIARMGERGYPKPLAKKEAALQTRKGSISKRAREAMLASEDRRLFHPDKEAGGTRPVVAKEGRHVRYEVRKDREVLPWRIAFANPDNVLVCLRRKIRREVLHALKLTGKGSGARRHHWNENSEVEC